jgi:ABC-2 type transport system permease protein
MKSIFCKELKLSRKALIIWSAIMFLTAAFGMAEFYSLKDNLDVLMNGISGIPRIVRIIFGVDAIAINTPLGAYACMFYFYCIIGFAFAVYTGVFIIARDERFKTSEFLYTKPFARDTVVIAKMLAALVNMAVLALVALAGSMIFLVPLFPESGLTSAAISTTVGMFLIMLVFMAVGLLCAAASKTYGQGLLRAFLVLIACYVVSFAIEYAGSVNFLNFISPIRWFNVRDVTQDGIGPLYVLLAAIAMGIGVWLTLKFYKRRDIYV